MEARASGEQFDAPRLGLDELLRQLIDRAHDVLQAQDRLRGLLEASQSIGGDFELPMVLRRIVEAACDLLGARYGALGVIAPDGSGLEELVHVGLDDAAVARIESFPQGKGLLGALIDHPSAIRLSDLGDDVRSVGFPEGHPPMSSFLGVPVRVRDEVFGNLYLTESARGAFTADDEQLASALAATAGVAIENARLSAQSRRRQEWLEASTEVTRQLLTGKSEQELRLIAESVERLSDADIVTILTPDPSGRRLKVALAVGGAATTLSDDWYPLANTVAEDVMGSGRAALVDDASVDGRKIAVAERVSVGPVMVLPLVGSARVRGVLDVGRLRGRARFSAADLEMAATFAAHASLAMELAEARRDQQRSFLLEDRARIARDLHDHVIQQLFAAGLTVQGVASGIGDENTAGMLERVVDALDDSIKQIRTSIFQLKPQASGAVGGLRTSVLQVIDEVGQLLGIQPEVGFVGPVDTLVDAGLADDVVAVVREALSNVAKHADASKVGVHVRTTTSTLEVVVNDDGRGIGSSMRRSGLANIRRRAERRYGRVTVNEPAPHSGTTLRWTVPLR